ncbi:12806_t:CDS:2, partial [Ambispora gerdemannii]
VHLESLARGEEWSKNQASVVKKLQNQVETLSKRPDITAEGLQELKKQITTLQSQLDEEKKKVELLQNKAKNLRGAAKMSVQALEDLKLRISTAENADLQTKIEVLTEKTKPQLTSSFLPTKKSKIKPTAAKPAKNYVRKLTGWKITNALTEKDNLLVEISQINNQRGVKILELTQELAQRQKDTGDLQAHRDQEKVEKDLLEKANQQLTEKLQAIDHNLTIAKNELKTAKSKANLLAANQAKTKAEKERDQRVNITPTAYDKLVVEKDQLANNLTE